MVVIKENTMKKLLVALALIVASGPRWSYAFTWGQVGSGIVQKYQDLTTNVEENSKYSFLNGITPFYGWSVQWNEHRAGLKTSFYQYSWAGKYKVFSLDAGFEPPALDHFKDGKGSATLGGSLHIDQVITATIPDTVDLLKLMLIPSSALPFWNALSIGLSPAYDFDRQQPDFQITSGLQLKF